MDGFVQRPLTSIVGARGNKNEQVKPSDEKVQLERFFPLLYTPRRGLDYFFFVSTWYFSIFFFKKKNVNILLTAAHSGGYLKLSKVAVRT